MTVKTQNDIDFEGSEEQSYAFIATLRQARDKALQRTLRRYQLPKEYFEIHPSLLKELFSEAIDPSNLVLTVEKFKSMAKKGQYARSSSNRPERKILDKIIKDAIFLQKKMRQTYTLVYPDGKERKKVSRRLLDAYVHLDEINVNKGVQKQQAEILLENPVYGKRIEAYLTSNYAFYYEPTYCQDFYLHDTNREGKQATFRDLQILLSQDKNFFFLSNIEKIWSHLFESNVVDPRQWSQDKALNFQKNAKINREDHTPAQLVENEAESILILLQTATWMSVFADLPGINFLQKRNFSESVRKRSPRFLEEGEAEWIEEVFYWLFSIQMWEMDTRTISKISRMPKPSRLAE